MENDTLAGLVERGGIFYNVPGNSVKEVMSSLIGMVNFPGNMDRKTLLNAVLDRENLMSTGMGRGIALPHPRNPPAEKTEDQCIAIAFPGEPVDWNALDGKPVHTVILIVSATPKQHLHTLSRVSFLCQQESFLQLLRNRSPEEIIMNAIRDTEAAWK